MIELYCPDSAMRTILEAQLNRMKKDFTITNQGESYPTYTIKKHNKVKKIVRGKYDDAKLALLLS